MLDISRPLTDNRRMGKKQTQYSTGQVAAMTGLNRVTVYYHASRGLCGQMVAGRFLFTDADVETLKHGRGRVGRPRKERT